MSSVLDTSPERARRDAALENSSTLKALSVLEALVRSGRPASLSELMQATGLPKPSLHRTLALAILTHESVATLRRAILRQLVADVGETCNLSMLRRAEVVYLDRVEADWPLRLHLPVGGTVPCHCSASGKLLLALMPAAERDALVAELPLPAYTPHTITDRTLLAKELDRIAGTGYSVDDEEYVVGVACVAVPVRLAGGEAVAAVAVHAATARLPLQRAIELVPRLQEAARRIATTFE